MGALFCFIAALAVLGLVLLGFVFATQVFLSWLHHHGSTESYPQLVQSAEAEISNLTHSTIHDMFDLARRLQFQKRMDQES